MKVRTYKNLYSSFGILFSVDTVLEQWEPYESVRCFEPHLAVYFGRRQWVMRWEVSVRSKLGAYWLRQRKDYE